jgi:hypothetical protein
MDAALSPAIDGRSHEHALIFASTSVIRMRYAAAFAAPIRGGFSADRELQPLRALRRQPEIHQRKPITRIFY